MTRGPAYLDSGIFIAFLDRSDRHHAAARQLFADPPRRWYTSVAVVSETYGWFLHRLGEDAARIFRLALGELAGLQVLPVTAEHHADVLRTLERLRGRRLTYVDASGLVFLRALRIREVWGTDLDLALEGARVVPAGR